MLRAKGVTFTNAYLLPYILTWLFTHDNSKVGRNQVTGEEWFCRATSEARPERGKHFALLHMLTGWKSPNKSLKYGKRGKNTMAQNNIFWESERNPYSVLFTPLM